MSRRRLHHDDGLDGALAGLSRRAPSPDLTRPIMGRLGYMRVDRQVVRRRRFALWANRAGLAMVTAIALSIGWRVFESSPQSRRPLPVTIPQAISRDVQHQQQRLGTMIQTIRSIATPRAEFGSLGQPSSDQVEPEAPGDVPNQQEWPQEMRDDVNRQVPAPVRWV